MAGRSFVRLSFACQRINKINSTMNCTAPVYVNIGGKEFWGEEFKKRRERERVEIGGRKVKWFCQTVTNVTDDKSRGQSQSSVYRPKQRRQPYQTTLGNTISSEDSSRAKGAWVTDSTSPQQLLLPPLGDLGPGTADDEPVDVGREEDTVVDAPDHRTTELHADWFSPVRFRCTQNTVKL